MSYEWRNNSGGQRQMEVFGSVAKRVRVQWMPTISEPGIIQSASLAQGLSNSFRGSSSCNFYQRERERYAGQGEPFLLLLLVSFRFWRLRNLHGESSENGRLLHPCQRDNGNHALLISWAVELIFSITFHCPIVTLVYSAIALLLFCPNSQPPGTTTVVLG